MNDALIQRLLSITRDKLSEQDAVDLVARVDLTLQDMGYKTGGQWFDHYLIELAKTQDELEKPMNIDHYLAAAKRAAGLK